MIFQQIWSICVISFIEDNSEREYLKKWRLEGRTVKEIVERYSKVFGSTRWVIVNDDYYTEKYIFITVLFFIEASQLSREKWVTMVSQRQVKSTEKL